MSDRDITAYRELERSVSELVRDVRTMKAGAGHGPGVSYALPFRIGNWEISEDANGRLLMTNVVTGVIGILYGELPTWIVQTGAAVNVAAASTVHFDLFNAAGSGVILKVRSLLIVPTLTAVTGVGLTWSIDRTSAVGTGGTALTPRPADTANTALPAQVTARSKPAGGATLNYILRSNVSSSEETSMYAGSASQLNHLNPFNLEIAQPITCREGEGIRVVQTTSSSVGSTNILCLFTVE
jgi:hypothetical protein